MKCKLGESEIRKQAARGGCQSRAACDNPPGVIPMKIAPLVRVFVLFAMVGCATAQAQSVRVLRASYGVQGQSVDVTGRIQSVVNRGQFSFPVTNRFFGIDPAPGRNKGVFVTYVANGRQFSQQATENSTFTFRHFGAAGAAAADRRDRFALSARPRRRCASI